MRSVPCLLAVGEPAPAGRQRCGLSDDDGRTVFSFAPGGLCMGNLHRSVDYNGGGIPNDGSTGPMRILVVEDDETVADALKGALEGAGFAVDQVSTAEHARAALAEESFDLATVDIGLPRGDGLQFLGWLRQAGQALPVLLITARDRLEDRVEGLELGADDYLTKPFEIAEVVARCRALIRRSKAAVSALIVHGALSVNLRGRTATVNGQRVDLTAREWAVLEYLVMHSDEVVSKERLLQAISGWDSQLTPNAVEVYVSRLRAKLEPGGVQLRTIRGLGYRLDGSAG
jgi:DNA-binding response OmpR family regulator